MKLWVQLELSETLGAGRAEKDLKSELELSKILSQDFN